MRERILNLTRSLMRYAAWVECKLTCSDEPAGNFSAFREQRGNFRLNLVCDGDEDGHPYYVVEIDRHCLEHDHWVPVVRLLGDDAPGVQSLLRLALDEIEATPVEKATPPWLRRGLN